MSGTDDLEHPSPSSRRDNFLNQRVTTRPGPRGSRGCRNLTGEPGTEETHGRTYVCVFTCVCTYVCVCVLVYV